MSLLLCCCLGDEADEIKVDVRGSTSMVLRLRRLVLVLAVSLFLYYLWNRHSGPLTGHKHGTDTSQDEHLEETAVPKTKPGNQYESSEAVKLIPSLLGSGPPQTLKSSVPRIQHDFDESISAQEEKSAVVRDAFRHSWTGYKKHAWMKDELAPVSAGYRTTFSGWAATLIDSLDTLWIMGMTLEFDEAVAAIETIDFTIPDGLPINLFETTIRYLGGLLGAYDVSNAHYPSLLDKAIEVADMLLEAFQTPSKMPVLRWSKEGFEVAPGDAIMSELGSLSLEFIRLSQLTGSNKYSEAVQRITDCIYRQQMSTVVPGLLPTSVNARECDFSQGNEFSLGAHVDSAYEYMPKTHQLLAGRTIQYRELYTRAVEPIKQHLLFRPMTPSSADILLAGTLKVFRHTQFELSAQMQHLSCFAGGMLALGSKLFSLPADLEIAKKLTDGCIWSSNATQTGIMPEAFYIVPCSDRIDCPWDEETWGKAMQQKNSFDDKPSDKQLPFDQVMKLKAERLRMPKGMTALTSRQYKLRPEVIESVFILYRITGDEALREHAWRMFQAIVSQTRTEYAFSNIEDVTTDGSRKMDKMESYWTAETLKYFYLIFSAPDVVSLDEWVFNTEAHPFRLDWRRQ